MQAATNCKKKKIARGGLIFKQKQLTSFSSGKPLVLSLEKMSFPLTVTSKDSERETIEAHSLPSLLIRLTGATHMPGDGSFGQGGKNLPFDPLIAGIVPSSTAKSNSNVTILKFNDPIIY